MAAAPYFYATDGTDTGTVPAASASNPRIDVIWVEPNDNVEDGGGLLGGVIGYSQGTPASSPAPPLPGAGTPALPARAMVLAQITVPKATTGNPSVAFVAPYTTASGGLLPVRTQAERDALVPHDGTAIYREDTNNIEVYNGASWDVWWSPVALEGFGGTPLNGAYDATKPIRKLVARKLGNSDASGLTTATGLPAGTTALLAVDLGMNLITGQTILVRTDLSNLSSVVFQLRNAASPYAALATTAYDFNHTIWYQK
ncbi:MAG TPA: hypothetical protein VJ851_00620 [Jatrophihabitans sp.]|nr:hypothetical protein [Jatrophihabitans sp.]